MGNSVSGTVQEHIPVYGLGVIEAETQDVIGKENILEWVEENCSGKIRRIVKDHMSLYYHVERSKRDFKMKIIHDMSFDKSRFEIETASETAKEWCRIATLDGEFEMNYNFVLVMDHGYTNNSPIISQMFYPDKGYFYTNAVMGRTRDKEYSVMLLCSKYDEYRRKEYPMTKRRNKGK
jgi:hypothetical protein